MFLNDILFDGYVLVRSYVNVNKDSWVVIDTFILQL